MHTPTPVRLVLATLATGLVVTAPAHAAPGALDKSFSGDGKVVTPFGLYGAGNGVAVQPNGRIVVAGTTEPKNDNITQLAFLRYRTNGALDPSFGGDGKVASTSAKFSAGLSSVALQPDGKIVGAGTCDGEAVVTRLLTNGAEDPAFASQPSQGCSGDTDSASDVAIEPSGTILVSGQYHVAPGHFAAFLRRLNTDGTGNAGLYDTGDGSSDLPAFALQGDGDIVITGDVFERLQPNGSPDTFFNPGSAPYGRDDVAVDGAGRVLTVGEGSTLLLDRRLPSGAVDPSFGGGSAVHTAIGTGVIGVQVHVALDGKIIVTGTTRIGTRNDVFVARYLDNGQLDPSFGNGGITLTDFGADASGLASTIEADGKIVVTGTTSAGVLVARYLGDPIPTCNGKKPTIAGTGLVLGSTGNDVIAGSGGADHIYGGDGADTVCAGDGNDTVEGGLGNDVLHGGNGADRVLGDAGNDSLFGEAGNDSLFGGAGRDKLDGGPDTDSADGGTETDTGVHNESQTNIP